MEGDSSGKRREREVDRGRDGFDVTRILPLIFDSNLMYDVSPAAALVLWGKNAYMFSSSFFINCYSFGK